jgi:hypothetical protein
LPSELKTATGAEAQALRTRSARLISSLKPDTLRRLVQMGGDATRRNAFIQDASEGMAVEAVGGSGEGGGRRQRPDDFARPGAECSRSSRRTPKPVTTQRSPPPTSRSVSRCKAC